MVCGVCNRGSLLVLTEADGWVRRCEVDGRSSEVNNGNDGETDADENEVGA